MNKSVGIDKVLKVLSFNLIVNINTLNPNKYFDRVNRFSTSLNKDIVMRIEWWDNISYLIVESNEMKIPFDNLEISGTWPNGYKNNIQFSYNGSVCCIIPLEKY